MDLSNELSDLRKKSVNELPDKLKPPADSEDRRSGTLTAVANLICTSMNGTVLSLPFIFAKCGVIVAPLLILAFALSTLYTLDVMCLMARKLGVPTYSGILEKLSNLGLRIFFTCLLFLVVFASMVGFLILLRQIGTDIFFSLVGISIRPFFIMLIGTLLSFPIMLQRSLFHLKYSCYVSCCCVLILLINLTVVVGYHLDDKSSREVHAAIRFWPDNMLSVLESIPIVAVFFLPHFNMTDVFESIQEPSVKRTRRVIYITVTALTTVFLTLGFFGYFAFIMITRTHVVDNILNAFPSSDRTILVGRIALFITVICTLPVMMVPAREFIDSLKYHIYEVYEWHRGVAVPDEEAPLTKSKSSQLFSQWQEQEKGRRQAALDALHHQHPLSGGSGDNNGGDSGGNNNGATGSDRNGESGGSDDNKGGSGAKGGNGEYYQLGLSDPGDDSGKNGDSGRNGGSGRDGNIDNYEQLGDGDRSGRNENQRNDGDEDGAESDISSDSGSTDEDVDVLAQRRKELQAAKQKAGKTGNRSNASLESLALDPRVRKKLHSKRRMNRRKEPRHRHVRQKRHELVSSDKIQQFFLTLVIIAVAFVIAFFMPDQVSLVWQIAGSLVVIPVTVLVPSLCFILLGRELKLKAGRYACVAALLFVLSVAAIISCGYWNIARLF